MAVVVELGASPPRDGAYIKFSRRYGVWPARWGAWVVHADAELTCRNAPATLAVP